jgi:hypothetical protein
MDLPVKDMTDLRSEIYRLKGLEQEQSLALAQRFSSPSALFSTLFSIIPKSPGTPNGEKSGTFFDQDIVGLLSRIVLPFTLNKTLFKNSGFIVKTLVGLVSQKASHFITEDSFTGIWDKVKSFLPGKHKEKKEEEHRSSEVLA